MRSQRRKPSPVMYRRDRLRMEIRLHEINQELDKTDAFESPPYRNDRRKLERERKRLWNRLHGEDVLSSVVGVKPSQQRYMDLNEKQKEEYRLRKKVKEIMEEIEVKPLNKWR